MEMSPSDQVQEMMQSDLIWGTDVGLFPPVKDIGAYETLQSQHNTLKLLLLPKDKSYCRYYFKPHIPSLRYSMWPENKTYWLQPRAFFTWKLMC